MKLYLIRHGKTQANELRLYCGSADIPLSENGVKDLRNIHYTVPASCQFMTSGMIRTEQTLYYLFGDKQHSIDKRFREIDFGVFEMHSYEELRTRKDYQEWLTGDNEKNVPPLGESGDQMKQRVLEGLEELLKQQRDTVLITHGGVIAAIMAHLFPKENKHRYAWQPEPGGGYLVTEDSWGFYHREL